MVCFAQDPQPLKIKEKHLCFRSMSHSQSCRQVTKSSFAICCSKHGLCSTEDWIGTKCYWLPRWAQPGVEQGLPAAAPPFLLTSRGWVEYEMLMLILLMIMSTPSFANISRVRVWNLIPFKNKRWNLWLDSLQRWGQTAEWSNAHSWTKCKTWQQKINISPILKRVAIQLVDRVLQVGGHEDQVQTAAGEELATDAGFSTLDMLNTISCIGITMRRLNLCKRYLQTKTNP